MYSCERYPSDISVVFLPLPAAKINRVVFITLGRCLRTFGFRSCEVPSDLLAILHFIRIFMDFEVNIPYVMLRTL